MDYVEEGDTRNLKGSKGANKRLNHREMQERKIKSLLRKDQADAEKEKNNIQLIEDLNLNKKAKKLEEKIENTESKKKAYKEDMEKCMPKIKGKHSISNNRGQ